ncbi:MAG: ribbon-helix-helix protein, CopG family [Candidatus Dormibacteria bacterium]
MKRTTISLPEAVAEAAVREARRRGTSVAEVAREALISHLGLSEPRGELPFAGLGRSGRRDTARRMDELLAREWLP